MVWGVMPSRLADLPNGEPPNCQPQYVFDPSVGQPCGPARRRGQLFARSCDYGAHRELFQPASLDVDLELGHDIRCLWSWPAWVVLSRSDTYASAVARTRRDRPRPIPYSPGGIWSRQLFVM